LFVTLFYTSAVNGEVKWRVVLRSLVAPERAVRIEACGLAEDPPMS
jgi:hypothetical protein